MWVKICQNAWLLHLKVNKKDQKGIKGKADASQSVCISLHWHHPAPLATGALLPPAKVAPWRAMKDSKTLQSIDIQFRQSKRGER
jgi:hypothetical protein